MKLVIFLSWKPVLTETFILNEFDILHNADIDFKVYYAHKYYGIRRNPELGKYNKSISYVPQLPKNFFRKIGYIIYYQVKTLFFNPVNYFRILLWVLIHYKRYLLRDFFRISPFFPELSLYSPNLIYCHYTYDNAIFAFLTKKYLHMNKYFTIAHQQNFYEPIISNFKTSIFPDIVVVKSDYVKNLWIRKYPNLPTEKIIVLPWGIDTKFFSSIKQRQKNREFTILSVSRLIEQKGIIFLLQACKILKERKFMFRCLIYGNGSEKATLLRYIQKNHLGDYITIKNFQDNKRELKKILSTADVFVLPCVFDETGEGDIVPNILLEAMSMELPVITTQVGGMNDYIRNGENGFIIDNSDAIQLANKIIKVINMPLLKRIDIGRKARLMVRHNWDKEELSHKFIEFLKRQS